MEARAPRAMPVLHPRVANSSPLDSDDVWLPGKLDAELQVFKEFPGAEAVLSDSQNFFEHSADGPSRFTQNGLLAATGGEVRWAGIAIGYGPTARTLFTPVR